MLDPFSEVLLNVSCRAPDTPLGLPLAQPLSPRGSDLVRSDCRVLLQLLVSHEVALKHLCDLISSPVRLTGSP